MTTVQTKNFTLEGHLVLRDGVLVLAEARRPGDDFFSDEPLSVNLPAHLEPGEVFIKDWSEHAGLAEALTNIGAGEVVSMVTVGPYSLRAFRFQVSPTVPVVRSDDD